MIIELKQHYHGLQAGGIQYSPGIYDTDKGQMPARVATYLLQTEQAVLIEQVSTLKEAPAQDSVQVSEVATVEKVTTPPKKGRK